MIKCFIYSKQAKERTFNTVFKAIFKNLKYKYFSYKRVFVGMYSNGYIKQCEAIKLRYRHKTYDTRFGINVKVVKYEK